MSQDPVTRAQQRENEDPEEAVRPMPVAALLVAAGMVVWAVVYILSTEPLTLSQFGDQRTRAELSGPVAAAGGAVDGKALYAAQCAACHQATGAGLPGVFPPLDGSEWVQGEPRVLANILLHGITGEITVKGNKYQGAMPAFPQLSDAELAGIASFIRGNWSNKAEPLQAELFAKERADGSRTTPFEGEAALKALSP
ncbi:MAG TPA: cytochrome c [Alicycliphilus sp.]|jgi:mono/diheme cytochrome c family protein|nr:c-type cytochrome [Alicycliphilus sp.]MCA0441785.1 cytochrome c [Pseudomonadota bacterium]TXJ05503.1 MAG: c-type cytochrome [Alicycliphilus sp.]HPU19570.1 cytochrome c [Alicycliphilus sp.]HRO53799.1 cytochrome c [Alicycliphilus sp.]